MDNKIQNPSEELIISMFGGFELTYDTCRIHESVNRSKKLWKLLAYMITYRNKNISQSEYIDVIWGHTECSNPENALKNLFYRIRILLEPIHIKNEYLILTTGNSYKWNNSLPCKIDIEIFENNIKMASYFELDPIRRIRLYKEAIYLYKGNFLSNYSNELWVMPLTTHYHNLFLSAVKSLAILLESEQQYEEMLNVLNYAIQIDSFDEKIHILLIKAYLYHGNNSAALSQYKASIETIYKILGVKPSTELRALYQLIMKVQKKLQTDISVIKMELEEENQTSGAFVCEYGFFQEVYRLEARQSEASRYVYICLLTITQSNGTIPSLDILNIAMERLLDTISSCLRRSDIVARYSKAQYIIMVPTKSFEDCESIMQNIINSYYSRNRKSLLQIKYNIEAINNRYAIENGGS